MITNRKPNEPLIKTEIPEDDEEEETGEEEEEEEGDKEGLATNTIIYFWPFVKKINDPLSKGKDSCFSFLPATPSSGYGTIEGLSS